MFRTYQKIAAALILFLSGSSAQAQVSITGLGKEAAYTQDFNTLNAVSSVNWVNNSTLPNWYADRSNGSLTTLVVSNGTNSNPSLYNFGATGSADRALGSIGSGNTGNYYWGVRMKNNTNATITAFNISFTGEQWRNSKASAQSLEFSYRTSASAITSVVQTSGTWNTVTALDFTSPVKGGTAYALDGNLAANRTYVEYTVTGISLAPGSEIMFRWTDINHKANDHALAIDDVTIAALTPNQYYSKSAGDLSELNTWGSRLDGSGNSPANFTNPGQIFNIRNGSAKTIAKSWTVSGFGSKVILDNGGSAVNFTIPAGTVLTAALDLQANATLTVRSAAAPNLGTLASTSTVDYAQGNQLISAATYGNLTVSGTGEKQLNSNITVRGKLSFTSGSLVLKDNNLLMQSGSTITGANAANYIKTKGTGALMQAIGKGQTVTFPVGTETTYNPATITLANSSTADNFYVSVMPKLYTAYDETFVPTGSEITSKVVNTTWIMEEETEGGTNATVQFQWTSADEQLDFNRSQTGISQYTTEGWTTSTLAPASGSSPYTRSLANVTSFSVFGVTGENAPLNKFQPLPVELLSFKAMVKGNGVELNWATATELNNDKFIIERSGNGMNWTEAGQVRGHGNSSSVINYTFTDQVNGAEKQLYYRLKQVDYNGTFEYSKVATVKFNKTLKPEIALAANPVKESLRFNLNGSTLENATLQIYTIGGLQVKTLNLTQMSAEAGTSVNNLPAGIYIYTITSGQEVLSTGKFIKAN
ncbi:T9SS type A sorting domain-containing protein [Adhaeribacter soli]|uniref:T9SS type A sorting domain-containing protein n=1 Tax=Adhaeribacter soli TaxID=2607655 RepID=A0A5N1J9M5_9BACT|nr:T9SS type A sorting domain-containing protein [Adhaeribacter soli]KAA9345698.1 T9SS type A sorting domain-containing protein [Adhaeribacter soli]